MLAVRGNKSSQSQARESDAPQGATLADHPFARGLLWGAALLVLLAGLALFVKRGVVEARDPGSNMDSALVLNSTRVWIENRNPYDPAEVEHEWRENGGTFDGANPANRGRQGIVYPPSAYALFAPLAFVRGHAGELLWTAANSVFYLATVAMLVPLAGLGWRHPLAVLLVGLCLASGGAQKTLSLGQPGSLLLFLVMLGITLRHRGHHSVAGMLMGAAAIAKPQFAALFVGRELIRGRPRVFAAACIWAVVLAMIGIVALELGGVSHWFTWWRENLAAFTDPGGEANLASAGDRLYQIMGLHTVLYVWGLDARSAQIVTLVLLACALALFAWLDRARGAESTDQPGELCSLSFTALVTLLATYHRYYDTILLVFSIALACGLLYRRKLVHGLVTLAITAPLLLPTPSALNRMRLSGSISESTWNSPLVQKGFMFHHQYLAILLLAWLFVLRASMRPGRIAKVLPPTT